MGRSIKSLVISTFLILISSSIVQGESDSLWIETIGGASIDNGRSVQQTQDGGYIITGNTKSFGAGDYDIWLIRMDAFGDTLWTKTFGGSNADWGYSVQQTTEGGFIVAGYTGSFGAGSNDFWLIKTDDRGDTLWTKTFGGNNYDYGNSVQQTTDSGYIMTGCTRSFGNGNYDLWLIKTDESGDTLWTKTCGGNNDEEGFWVQQTSDGGYIITGTIETVDSAGATDLWLVKTNESGDTLWTKRYGRIGYDYGSCVRQTTDGGYIIVGSTRVVYMQDYDIWLIKTNAVGDTLWTKTFVGNNDDYGSEVQQTADGGYIIVGSTFSYGAGFEDIWLIKTNSSGEVQWTKTFGGSSNENGQSVQQTKDGDYIITGTTNSFGMGQSDIFIIKTTSAVTDIQQNSAGVANEFLLSQNYPNPFNPTTNLSFVIGQSSFVTLKVYDVLGNEVAALVNEEKPAGNYTLKFDGSRLASGIYFYQITAGSFKATKKLILLK